MKLREQMAQQPPYIRRASLPPAERTASYYHAGTRPGMHPEDTPSITTTRKYHMPATTTIVEYTAGEDVSGLPTRTSARRYDLAPYTGRGAQETEELARRGKHPLFSLGLCLVIMVAFLTAYTLIPPAFQKWRDERMYGYPRTFQTDASVGHGGVEHFITLNNHGTIEVLEIPGAPGNTTQPRLYIIVRLTSEGADLVPATVSFPDINADGKPDMQVTVYDGANPSIWILFNNGTSFVPKL
jgi:hypothetical protein